MITTREAINYQFSLIFGYSSPKNDEVTVGDIIGPGNLTKEKIKELSLDVIKFLKMYNAILRDYTGSELFCIEFSLFNKDELQKQRTTQIQIFPKSMVLIPGKYKDCESLLLALKPETEILNVHKSKDSMNDISRIFSEIEEFSERPELGIEGREQLLETFATRFSKKLFGELVEEKWNKKLVGLNVSTPTGKDNINEYASIKSDVEILWHKNPHEINVVNPKFEKRRGLYEGKTAIEHLKFSISEPSANFIVENTLKLGANLFNLANSGTVDESQDNFIFFITKLVKQKIEKINEVHSINWLIETVDQILSEIHQYTNKFLEYSKKFLITGERGDLKEVIEKFKIFIVEKGSLENENFEEILNLAIDSINQSIIKDQEIRAVELSSSINYLEELFKSSYEIIKKSLPRYLTRRRLKTITIDFVEFLKEKFEKEQKPSRILGNEYIEKYHEFLLNLIEINPLVLTKNPSLNEEDIISEFKNMVKANVDLFFSKISLNIEDIISFAEVEMEKESISIRSHIEKFKRFSNELHYLSGFILKYTTMNRFLKEETDETISDPVSFANRFHRFLEKRIGGINLAWKSYVLTWMNDYAKQFFKILDRKEMNLEEIYTDFIEYFEQREFEEQKPEKFLEFLDKYIAKITDEEEKLHLVEFFKQFEYCIEIKNIFPDYVKTKIEAELNILDLKPEELMPINFFSIDGHDTFYNYVKEVELKYFSKLIPRPLSLILRHDLSKDEGELFNGQLYHVINFKYWHDYSKYYIADNFKTVYREWEKQI
jgi:hypothetical protein